MTKSKKLGLVLSLVLVIALALVISASATIVDTIEVDALSQNSSGVFSLYGGNYPAITSDNFVIMEINIFEYDGDKPYYKSYVVSNIEAFQIEFYGLDYFQFLEALQNYSYYGIAEYQYQYLMSWTPPISQDVYNELQDDYNSLENTFNTLESAFQELQFSYDDLAQRSENAYNALQGEYNTLQGEYNTLQGEYNTLQDDYTTLNDSIPRIRYESRLVGYNEGMRDADAIERGVMSIVGSPMYILTSVFDVEIFGINLLNLITTIMTVIIVAWVIKKLAN